MKRCALLSLAFALVLSLAADSRAGLLDLFSGNGHGQANSCCQPQKKHCLFGGGGNGLFGWLHHKEEPVCPPAPPCEPYVAPGAKEPSAKAPKKPYEETPPVPGKKKGKANSKKNSKKK